MGVGRSWRPGGPLVEPSGSAVKGGELTFTFVRDDGTHILAADDDDDEHAVFRDGDRFKVLVTCPPTERAVFDVLVLDEAGVSFPLGQPQALECGNEVPLRGAFRLTGATDEEVCVAWSEHVDAALSARTARDGELVGARAGRRCRTLRPSSESPRSP